MFHLVCCYRCIGIGSQQGWPVPGRRLRSYATLIHWSRCCRPDSAQRAEQLFDVVLVSSRGWPGRSITFFQHLRSPQTEEPFDFLFPCIFFFFIFFGSKRHCPLRVLKNPRRLFSYSCIFHSLSFAFFPVSYIYMFHSRVELRQRLFFWLVLCVYTMLYSSGQASDGRFLLLLPVGFKGFLPSYST